MRVTVSSAMVVMALAVQMAPAQAGVSTFEIDWSKAYLTMSSGAGSVTALGTSADVEALITTATGSLHGFGNPVGEIVSGNDHAKGGKGYAEATMTGAGSSQAITSGTVGVIDIEAHSTGTFYLPYSFKLDTRGSNDLGGSIQYSYQNPNYQFYGLDSMPLLTVSATISAAGGALMEGSGLIAINVNNDTSELLRYVPSELLVATSYAQGVGGAPVPEPATYGMLLTGLAMVGLMVRGRNGAGTRD